MNRREMAAEKRGFWRCFVRSFHLCFCHLFAALSFTQEPNLSTHPYTGTHCLGPCIVFHAQNA